jgi:hypothetical protein
MKTNTCNTPTCDAALTTQQMLDNPSHGWTWTDKYGWGCPQHPAPGQYVYGTRSVDLLTSWGEVLKYVGDVPTTQHKIDHLARQCGMTPPDRYVEGCSYCEDYPEGTFAPSHWPSTMCQSGARPHCTCDACF